MQTCKCRGGWRIVAMSMAVWAGCSVMFQPQACAQQEGSGKDLHYFIVDRSGSIDTRRLTKPITKAVVDYLDKLRESDEVFIRFFSDRISEVEVFPSMTDQEKSRSKTYFKSEFRPGGGTYLYDAAYDSLKEIDPQTRNYRSIRLMILSDGKDEHSRRITSWDRVNELACRIQQNNPMCLIQWIAISSKTWKPDPIPTDCIQSIITDKIDVEVFDLPPAAAFMMGATNVPLGDTVLFSKSYSMGAISNIVWDFGDGTVKSGTLQELQNCTHLYKTLGPKKVVVTVKGPGGADSATNTLVVTEPVIPKADAGFVITPNPVLEGRTITLTARTNELGMLHSWTLDGKPCGEGPEVSNIVMPEVGSYKVVHKVEFKGAVSEADGDVVVTPDEAKRSVVVIATPLDGASVTYGQQTNFMASVVGPKIEEVFWKIEDPIEASEKYSSVSTSRVSELVHEFAPHPDGQARDVTIHVFSTEKGGAPVVTGTPVRIKVVPPERGVVIVEPKAGGTAEPGSAMQLTAQVSGPIVKVSWSVMRGTDTIHAVDASAANGVSEATWKVPQREPEGQIQIRATASDDQGNPIEAMPVDPVHIKYQEAKISILAPVAGKKFIYGEEIAFEAETEGTVDEVVWRIEGLGLGVKLKGKSVSQRISQPQGVEKATLTVTATPTGPGTMPPSATVQIQLHERALNPQIKFKMASDGQEKVTYRMQNDPVEPRLEMSGGASEIVWNFGDGTVVTGDTPSHAYADYRIYEIRASARRAVSGKIEEAPPRTVTVECVPPTEAKFDFLVNGRAVNSVSRGTVITLQDRTEGDILERQWFRGSDLVSKGGQSQIDEMCKAKGTRDYTLKVRDCNGKWHETTRSILVIFNLPYWLAGLLWVALSGVLVRFFTGNGPANWLVRTGQGEKPQFTKTIRVRKYWVRWSKRAAIPLKEFSSGAGTRKAWIKLKANRMGKDIQPTLWYSPKTQQAYLTAVESEAANARLLVDNGLPEDDRTHLVQVEVRHKTNWGDILALVTLVIVLAAVLWKVASYFA